MKFIADFHIHSKYSRATSPQMDLFNLDKWAKIKGINLMGTGDFTHPEWFKHLKDNLESAEPGFFKIKSEQYSATKFILTSEISCIYSKKGKIRKVHIIVFSPSFSVVEKINNHLGVIGNLKADGRPILGLDAKELLKIILNVSEDCLIVPAHLMTPWFGLFGSKSGFDSLEDCFEEYSKYIYAGETGLSADPAMLWRMPDCRKITLLSNSDAHSPSKIGREVNVFNTNIDYQSVVDTIKSRDLNKFLYTIEFYPEQGKYHFDGHRNCGIVFSPQESKKYNNICPSCGKPLTVGVLNRVEKLADRPEGFKPENNIPFKNLVPLEEIIAMALNKNTGTKQVEKAYFDLIEKGGSEFNILLDLPRSEIDKITSSEISEVIIKVREGRIYKYPGYDGVYGKVKIFPDQIAKRLQKQKTLF